MKPANTEPGQNAIKTKNTSPLKIGAGIIKGGRNDTRKDPLQKSI